jgi:hypothetical protein
MTVSGWMRSVQNGEIVAPSRHRDRIGPRNAALTHHHGHSRTLGKSDTWKKERHMENDELIDAYHAARGDYESAKSGGRPEMFAKFLVAERVLTVRLGSFDRNVEHFRERYSP